ncbi:hypothetical protein Tco_0385740 [Tanacetum coccineum]
MSFSKRSDTAPVCYTKPLDLLKHWNDNFFWVDASAFPLSIPWHNNKTLKKTPIPHQLNLMRNHYYEFDDDVYPVFLTNDDEEMDLFAFINHADPIKVRIGEKQIEEGQSPLLESTRGRVVPLAGVDDQGDQNNDVQDAPIEVGIVRIEDEVPLTVAEKARGSRKKRKAAGGASGSSIPPKKLRADHVGVTAVATLPFITSSVSLTPEREGDGHTDSVTGPNLRTQHLAKRYVISSDSSHHSNANAADDEVTSIVRSSAPPPPVLTTSVATTAVSASVDVAGPSQPADAKVSTDTFYISQKMDSETLQQTYVPKWNVINDSALNDHEACFSAEVMLRSEHNYIERKKFETKCQRQINLLKEKDTEIANLKAQLSLKEAEEQNSALEEEKSVLESKVVALESVDATKVAELASLTTQTAKLTQYFSELGLSCDELIVKASSLEAERDRFISQVSLLEGTCSELCDELSGYKLFKEQIEVVQDEQVKVLSDKVVGLDAELMGTALHLDEEFYPRFLTTIVGRRWILGRGLRLVVMKCLQSLEYLVALGGAIGRANDKGMQDGLATCIDHGKAGRGLVDVAAYNPSAEANYVFVVNALRDVDFPLLAQLESQKDASIVDIMGLLHLEGPAAEVPEANQLQPSLEQLMLLIYRSEDQVVIGETSLSFSLDIVHSHPLSAENLVGEASTSGVPAVVTATTTLSTTFVEASSVLPIPASDYEVVDTEAQDETSSSHKIIFEEETLETSPENPAT